MSNVKEETLGLIHNIDDDLAYSKQVIEHAVAHGQNAFDGKTTR